jgi:hypothetical protein
MTLRVSAVCLLTLIACLAKPAPAQQVVVQQPVFQQFVAPTTVLVPDRGGAWLGGVGGVGQGRNVPGPIPMSRGTATSSGSSSVQVRAYVHDFRAMDEAILGTAAPRASDSVATTSRAPRRLAAPAFEPVAHLRADVDWAMAEEAAHAEFMPRVAAIQRLIDVHNRLAADPRRSRSAIVRGLERRVATRLVDVHRDLVAMVSWPAPARSDGEPAKNISRASGGDIAAAQSLIDLIQATVSPEIWDINGGQSSIRYFANGHALVVRAPGDTHDNLGGLLQQLR